MTKTLEEIEQELATVEADVDALKAAEPAPVEAPAAGVTGFVSELPSYICHKTVKAAKITAINGNTLVFALIGMQTNVNDAWLLQHKPEINGWYVQYDSGYSSYSPAGPFEAGYSKL